MIVLLTRICCYLFSCRLQVDFKSTFDEGQGNWDGIGKQKGAGEFEALAIRSGYTAWIYNKVFVSSLQLLYFKKTITWENMHVLYCWFWQGTKIWMLSLHASFYAHPFFELFDPPFVWQLLIPTFILQNLWSEEKNSWSLPTCCLWGRLSPQRLAHSPRQMLLFERMSLSVNAGEPSRGSRGQSRFTFFWSSAPRLERCYGFRLKKQEESQSDGWKRCLSPSRKGL